MAEKSIEDLYTIFRAQTVAANNMLVMCIEQQALMGSLLVLCRDGIEVLLSCHLAGEPLKEWKAMSVDYDTKYEEKIAIHNLRGEATNESVNQLMKLLGVPHQAQLRHPNDAGPNG